MNLVRSRNASLRNSKGGKRMNAFMRLLGFVLGVVVTYFVITKMIRP